MSLDRQKQLDDIRCQNGAFDGISESFCGRRFTHGFASLGLGIVGIFLPLLPDRDGSLIIAAFDGHNFFKAFEKRITFIYMRQ